MESADYIGLSDEAKLVVQKENRLLALSASRLSLDEFKILDAFLSRIDSHKPQKNHVRFDKGDLEKILNKKRINFEHLSNSLEGLFKDIELVDVAHSDGKIINLFEKTVAKRDEYGVWQLDLVCTDSAAEYFFNVEKFGYIRYMLANISVLSSRASYLLYILLEGERNKAINYKKGNKLKFKKSIEDIKAYLGCNYNDYYMDFRRFNEKILKKCHEEINKKTTLKYNYKPVDKRGYYYLNIEFEILNIKSYVDSKKDLLPEKKQVVSEEKIDFTPFIIKVFINLDISVKQVANLNMALSGVSDLNSSNAEKFLKDILIRYSEQSMKQTIENPYGYIMAIIKNEAENRNENERFNAMNDEERKADFERRLEAMKADNS